MINDLNERITRSAYPGAHLVEFFPVLQYVPRRFAKWRREAEDWFQRYTQLFEKYYGDIASRVVSDIVVYPHHPTYLQHADCGSGATTEFLCDPCGDKTKTQSH